MKKESKKPARVAYFQVPRPLWRMVKRVLPKVKPKGQAGRPACERRAVLNGIWYVLWTGCQWKAVKREWFGVSSSTLHRYFQAWQRAGVFEQVFRRMLRCYGRNQHVQWRWQALDSRSGAAPLGGEATGHNPTDRAKSGSKIHLLVDQRGAPLAVQVSAANRHDQMSVYHLILALLVKRPSCQQHLCADAGYDSPVVYAVVRQAGYIPHIKRRRRRGEPAPDPGPMPGEVRYPPRRWVVERTFSWLVKRRSLRTRWCKKVANWLAFLYFACADILCSLTFLG